MKYLDLINSLIKEEVAKPEKLVLFGQNISAGSCLGGLTKGLSVRSGGKIINTTNTESSLCGFGFGMMMNGTSSVFFMKQLDFLLLGIDQLTNTHNALKNMAAAPSASFTIMAIVMDNGYQGMQSSLNNLADFCSIAGVPGYVITNAADAREIIPSELTKPGFRIIAVSQRLFKEEILEPKTASGAHADREFFEYSDGKDATIVSFNFSFPQAWKLQQDFAGKNIKSSLFHVNSQKVSKWNKIIERIKETGKLIIIDDSKTENSQYRRLLNELSGIPLQKKILILRELGKDWLNPVPDTMVIDSAAIIEKLTT